MARQVAPVWSPSQGAAQREAKRRPVFYTYINLWPFVAVLFALVIAFLGAAPPFDHSIHVDLPSALHQTLQPNGEAEDAIKISIDRDGRVFFRDMRVLPEGLPGFIHDALRDGSEKKAYLAIDSRSKFADTTLVVEQIGKAGIRNVSFLTEKAISQ